MATIGHHRAMAEFGNKRLSGVIAWLLWSVVHVFLRVGGQTLARGKWNNRQLPRGVRVLIDHWVTI
jgi:NADH dehydrogenase